MSWKVLDAHHQASITAIDELSDLLKEGYTSCQTGPNTNEKPLASFDARIGEFPDWSKSARPSCATTLYYHRSMSASQGSGCYRQVPSTRPLQRQVWGCMESKVIYLAGLVKSWYGLGGRTASAHVPHYHHLPADGAPHTEQRVYRKATSPYSFMVSREAMQQKGMLVATVYSRRVAEIIDLLESGEPAQSCMKRQCAGQIICEGPNVEAMTYQRTEPELLV